MGVHYIYIENAYLTIEVINNVLYELYLIEKSDQDKLRGEGCDKQAVSRLLTYRSSER